MRRAAPLGAAMAAAGLALAACGDHALEGKDCPAAARARTVSGFCVPRYLSLKRGEVMGRGGPGKDYPARWVYHVQGLPVQVVAETTDWRRICDPDGGAVWVHRSMVDGRRTVMALGAAPIPLRHAPRSGSPAAGLLNARALAALERCAGGWCEVKAGGVAGWAPHMIRSTQTSYDRDDLLACARGETFGPGNAQLPYPPMLMFDRITAIDGDGGAHGKGALTAELDIRRDLWFFDCHFIGDPVMPGCLGLDAMWQLVGFFLGWSGAPGRGRALGVGEVKFTGQVTPNVGKVVYRIELKRLILRKLVMGVADGVLEADGKPIYEARDLKVGLFSAADLV